MLTSITRCVLFILGDSIFIFSNFNLRQNCAISEVCNYGVFFLWKDSADDCFFATIAFAARNNKLIQGPMLNLRDLKMLLSLQISLMDIYLLMRKVIANHT